MYVGSHVYFFVNTTLTEVTITYILNFHNFSIIKGNPKYSPCTQRPWSGLCCFSNNTKTKYQISQISGE